MRIVMLTDDVQIDRRILLECISLLDEGNEVILIAAHDPARPEFEILDSIKIERLPQYAYTKFEILILNIQNRIINLLNRLSQKTQSIFSRIILAPNPLIKKYSRQHIILQKSFSGYQKIIHFILKIVLKLITFIAIATNKFVHLTRYLINKSSRMSVLDKLKYKRIKYYDPDVIHVHDLPQLKAGVFAKRELNVPLIYDAHEFYPEQPRLTKKQSHHLRKIENKYIHYADIIFTVNPLLAKEMEKTYKNISVGVLQNAIDPQSDFNVNDSHDRFREEYDFLKDKILLLYQGWIANERNLENIIEGMKLVNNDRFHLLIMGYGDYVATLQEMVKDLGVTDKVTFISSKSQDELLSYTASADIGLIPYPYGKDLNTHYVSPNKLYEFISACLPILSNDLPFVRSVIEKNGFGVAGDLQMPQAFADTLNDFPLAKLEEFRAALLQKHKKFEWHEESRILIDCYSKLDKR